LSNSPSAILFLHQSSLQQFIFPLQQSPSSNFPSAKKIPIKKKKNLPSSFSESFISIGKQGGRATVLREGLDVVNSLGKAAEMHLTFSLSSAAGAVPNLSLQII
jgi:hypothetical protein